MELEKFDKTMSPAFLVIDEALACFGQNGIFDNNEIIIDKDMVWENHIQFKIKRKHNHTRVSFIISSGNIRIDIDRAEEIAEWSLDSVTNDKQIILEFLFTLLTSHIVVEYYGESKTQISMFDHEGRLVNTLKYQSGISFDRRRVARLYYPVYFDLPIDAIYPNQDSAMT